MGTLFLDVEAIHNNDIGRVQTPILVGPSLACARPIGRFLVPLPRPLGVSLHFHTGQGGDVVASVETVDNRPVIRFQSCPDVDAVYRRLIALAQPIMHITAANPDPGAAPVPGKCRICGCTMTRACPCGCWWADDTETLCRQHGSH